MCDNKSKMVKGLGHNKQVHISDTAVTLSSIYIMATMVVFMS